MSKDSYVKLSYIILSIIGISAMGWGIYTAYLYPSFYFANLSAYFGFGIPFLISGLMVKEQKVAGYYIGLTMLFIGFILGLFLLSYSLSQPAPSHIPQIWITLSQVYVLGMESLDGLGMYLLLKAKDKVRPVFNVGKLRPTGVSILGTFMFIGGIVMIMGGISLALLSSVDDAGMGVEQDVTKLRAMIAPISGLLSLQMLVEIILGLGVASLITGYDFLKGKRWAWKMAILLSFFAIAVYVLLLINLRNIEGIIGIIIFSAIVYYLHRPYVREYFSGQKIS